LQRFVLDKILICNENYGDPQNFKSTHFCVVPNQVTTLQNQRCLWNVTVNFTFFVNSMLRGLMIYIFHKSQPTMQRHTT